MATSVIHLFHGDEDSLSAGSHVAERIRQVAGEQGVALEVFCFGPGQGALSRSGESEVLSEYNQQIDELVAAGVRVGACVNAARAQGTEEALLARGITLEFARDAFVRYALEGATVLTF
ncbi:MAG: DsrE family protein [Acidimicrobiales bacterium]